ncbi:MAG: type IV secretion system DNA-binding domain-containing protein [Propionibacteriaceae bacterium]|jgi:hypothetical protein|nr:type IV secretion system DNA-binding domain-containing protein [Propionibacteriaceae bacterium]
MINEHYAESTDRTIATIPHPPVACRHFRLKGLVGRHDPAKAASWAVENLYNAVSEWPTDSMLALIIARHKKAIRIGGWVNDAAPADWLIDLAYALGPIAQVRPAESSPALATPLLEVVPARTDQGEALEGFAEPDTPQLNNRDSGRDAVPVHKNDPMWEFLSVLRTVPGAAMGVFVSPASGLEQQMSDSSWRAAFQGSSRVEWQMYRGTPIRTRVILYGDCPEIPARLRAELKIMSQRIAFSALTGQDRLELRQPTVDSIKGFAVPKQVFRALVHLPAAGPNRPAPGLKVLPPEPRLVPYDAPTRPAQAFRLGRCVNSHGQRRPVWISPSDMCRHMRFVGSTGSGKSTAIRGLLGPMIDDGYGVLLLDPHGSLCADLMGDIGDPDRALYVDYSDPTATVPFNALRGRTATEFEARLQAFINIIMDRDSDQYTGPRWRRAIGLAARGCHKLFGERCSLVAVFSVLGSPELAQALADAVKPIDEPLSGQIRHELANLTGSSNSDLWPWLVCKGEEILGSAALGRILGTGAHAVDLVEAMDDSRAVLVNLGLAELGERSAQLLGCLWVAELRQAMLERQRRDQPFIIAIDEAHLFQYGALPSLLDEARKFGVGVIVCHQRPDQLRFQLKDALSANAGSYIQLRTGNPQDAAQASKMLNGWPLDDLTRCRDLTGVAVLSRDGTPSEPFSIEFDFFKRNAERLADAELRQWRTERVSSTSRQALVEPYADWRPISRDTIVQDLREARSQNRGQRIAELKQSYRPRPRRDEPGAHSQAPAGLSDDALL